MKLAESVKPISYLKAHASAIIRDISSNHKTYVITHNGSARAIVQDVESYEKMRDSLALLKMLSQGEADVRAGRFKSLRMSQRNVLNRLRARECAIKSS